MQRVYAATTRDWQRTRAIAAAVFGTDLGLTAEERDRVLACLSDLADEGKVEHRLAPITSFPERGEWRRA